MTVEELITHLQQFPSDGRQVKIEKVIWYCDTCGEEYSDDMIIHLDGKEICFFCRYIELEGDPDAVENILHGD